MVRVSNQAHKAILTPSNAIAQALPIQDGGLFLCLLGDSEDGRIRTSGNGHKRPFILDKKKAGRWYQHPPAFQEY